MDFSKKKLPIDDPNYDVDDVIICFREICKHCYEKTSTKHYGIGYMTVDEENSDGNKKNQWHFTEPFIEDIFPYDLEDQIEVTHWMEFEKL